MILSGKTIENIVDYIDENTYGGILAQAALESVGKDNRKMENLKTTIEHGQSTTLTTQFLSTNC